MLREIARILIYWVQFRYIQIAVIQMHIRNVHAIVQMNLTNILEIDISTDILTWVLLNTIVRLIHLFGIHLLGWVVLTIWMTATIDVT